MDGAELMLVQLEQLKSRWTGVVVVAEPHPLSWRSRFVQRPPRLSSEHVGNVGNGVG